MKNKTNILASTGEALSSLPPLRSRPLLLLAAIMVPLLSARSTAFAGSATWQMNPTSGDWNTAANWTPATVPNSPSDTATFGVSDVTNVSTSRQVNVSEAVFTKDASAFNITVGLGDLMFFDGAGITNNSGTTQLFRVRSDLDFTKRATAGKDTSFLIEATPAYAGSVAFFDSSSAGQGSFVIQPTLNQITGDAVAFFFSESTAANANFTIGGGAANPTSGGLVEFGYNSSAGAGFFTANGGTVTGGGGGKVRFTGSSGAGAATLIANGGSGGGAGGAIQFTYYSEGGTPRVQVFGTGSLDISAHFGRRVVVGSVEGDGNIFLGGNRLTVGSNDLSTDFSGVIQDGGGLGGPNGDTGGSFTKVGRGKLVLSHRNTYTGGTTVKRGRLVVNNRGGSGTGSGPVQVNYGRLAGMGAIAGAVTVGTGGGSRAVLSPGYHHSTNPGTLTIQSLLTFNSDGIYEIEVDSGAAAADDVVAFGVTINSGAQVSFADFGSTILPAGKVFTVINNTSANPIAGTFANLPDNSTFTSNGNTYQASYEGGDGNDLTVRVQ